MKQISLSLKQYRKPASSSGDLNFFAGVYEIHRLKGHAVTYSKYHAECYSCKVLYEKQGKIIRKTNLTY